MKKTNEEVNADIKENKRKEKINIIKKYKEFKGFDIVFLVIAMALLSILIIEESCYLNQIYCDRFVIFDNLLVVFPIMLALYTLTGKPKLAMISSLVIWNMVSIANYILYKVRGVPFAVADIFSVFTAIGVAKDIKFDLSAILGRTLIFSIFAIVIISLFKFQKSKTWREKLIERGSLLFVAIVLLVITVNRENFKYMKYWNLNDTYQANGIEIAIIKQISNLYVEIPEDYSIEKAEEILNRYEKNIKEEEKTNIVVIVNETFSDINGVYDLGLEDNIPFFNSLKENTIKGTAYTSVYGGGTATAEWEFLTGNSAASVPANAIPFLLYIRDDKESIIRDAVSQNYTTLGMHSFKGKGYNRITVYPKIGFQKSLFIEDMKEYEIARMTHPSDLSTYKNFIKEYEARDKSKKFFGYILTMQNHSPYCVFNEEYKSKDYIKDNEELNQYLSLINDSDKALKYIIDYFSKEEEKTILLFFGDHQPKVEFEYFIKTEWLDSQKVPYMLWANFDIEEKDGEDISFNYLNSLIYDYANLDTNEYVEFLKEFREEIPVYTAEGYRDKDGNTYEIDDKKSPYYDKINEYKILQYYYMFDKDVE